MTNYSNNSAKFSERVTQHFTQQFTQQRGLYCVWVPAHNDGKAPLISIWIDPTMTAFDSQQESSELAGIKEGTVSDEIEDAIGSWPAKRNAGRVAKIPTLRTRREGRGTRQRRVARVNQRNR
jgi:hypothetical protein